jgi:phage-related protein (TIGR01555 family)
MSEMERLIRSINSYLKNQDVVFELLDEAKIDVYKMNGFNNALLNADGTRMIAQRVQGANQVKNFQHALVMDKDDEYEQKQIAFSGLGDILTQIRQGVAADVKMPMTKLFGTSAAGFSSGEDDIENYNSMIKNQVQAKTKHLIVQMLQICSQIKFGFMPDDLKIEWKSLRILGADEEEKVKDSQFNRVMSAYQSGLIPAEEAKKSINKGSLLPVEIDVDIPASEPIAGDFATASQSSTQKGTA